MVSIAYYIILTPFFSSKNKNFPNKYSPWWRIIMSLFSSPRIKTRFSTIDLGFIFSTSLTLHMSENVCIITAMTFPLPCPLTNPQRYIPPIFAICYDRGYCCWFNRRLTSARLSWRTRSNTFDHSPNSIGCASTRFVTGWTGGAIGSI